MKNGFIIITTIVFSICFLSSHAQNERKFVRQGNRIYERALRDTTKLDTIAFSQSEIAYRKALDKRPDDLKWKFNLGNSIYKQMHPEQSASIFEEIAKTETDKIEKSKAFYNLGNSLLMQQKLDESIEAYKNALRQNPNDLESKYNLLYAMNLKNQQQDQDQNKDQQDQDQNQDQQDQDQNQDQQNQDQNKDQQDQQNQQDQQQQQQKIPKEQAERLLQALENDEQKTQDKVKKAQAVQKQQTEKDW